MGITADRAGSERSVSATHGTTPRLYQQAEEVLARLILSGAVAPGSRLSETGVAERLGISRAPARQALQALGARGLVRKADGRGFVVCATPTGPAAGEADTDALSGAGADLRLSPAASWTRIYEAVENEIIARIPFGSWRVNEAEIARHHGVSRTVARDVVGRLQQRGLLSKDERSRWYAPALSPERVRELYELRAILEPAALLKAAPRAPKRTLARMLSDLDAAIADPASADGARLDDLEEALHVDLLKHCGNTALIDAIVVPQSLLLAHRYLYRWTQRLFATEPFLPEHRAIVERLIAGDPGAAAASLEDHLTVSSERAIARVAAVSREVAPEEPSYLHPL